jgi:DNA polymerase III psi subunit
VLLGIADRAEARRLMRCAKWVGKRAHERAKLHVLAILRGMRAKEGTFRDLMTQNRQFQVPLYQRHYRWRTGHQEDLWQDIVEQYARSPKVSPFRSTSSAALSLWRRILTRGSDLHDELGQLS